MKGLCLKMPLLESHINFQGKFRDEFGIAKEIPNMVDYSEDTIEKPIILFVWADSQD